MDCVGTPAIIVDAFHSGMRVVRVRERAIDHAWLELANVPQSFDECFEDASGFKSALQRPALDEIMGVPTDTPSPPKPAPPVAVKKHKPSPR